MRTGDLARAQAELTVATTDLPDDPAVRVRVAALLARVGAHERALETYRGALALAPRDAAALAGAGREALALARYATARSVPRGRARAGSCKRAGAGGARDAVGDGHARPGTRAGCARPNGHGGRTTRGHAGARLVACEAGAANRHGADLTTLPAQWQQRDAQTTTALLAREPDRLDNTMDLVFGVEEQTRASCGEPTGVDRALLLIGRDRRAVER